MISVDFAGAKLLNFSHVLFNFWITKELFYVAFLFEKQNNMPFVKSVFSFSFLTDFVLGAQMMICQKLLYRCHNNNRSEIPPSE